MAGDAVGVLPDYAVAEELSAGSLVALRTELPLPSIVLRLTTLWPPDATSPLAGLIDQTRATLRASSAFANNESERAAKAEPVGFQRR
jgi:DNA-binding transcriptional LysR family regulator